MNWVLFTWEIRKKAKWRRWFYSQLARVLSELSAKNWRKVGGSVYIVVEKHSHEFEELLERFKSPDLTWHKFEIKRFNDLRKTNTIAPAQSGKTHTKRETERHVFASSVP